MVHGGRAHRALRVAARIVDIVILTPVLLPGIGILLAPLVLVGCLVCLPSRAFRRWLEGLGGPHAPFAGGVHATAAVGGTGPAGAAISAGPSPLSARPRA
jgi:hypothetical protein